MAWKFKNSLGQKTREMKLLNYTKKGFFWEYGKYLQKFLKLIYLISWASCGLDF